MGKKFSLVDIIYGIIYFLSAIDYWYLPRKIAENADSFFLFLSFYLLVNLFLTTEIGPFGTEELVKFFGMVVCFLFAAFFYKRKTGNHLF